MDHEVERLEDENNSGSEGLGLVVPTKANDLRWKMAGVTALVESYSRTIAATASVHGNQRTAISMQIIL